MPFTFSHPAIVLPLSCLSKKWFSLTGLVIGSMTPDFEYFLRMKIKSNYSHSIAGLFWFDLPLGLLLAFIFHSIVRNKLFDNLPVFLQSRFSTFRQFDYLKYFKKNWLVVIISILIGAFSHLLWDGFTHAHGYFVEKIPALTGKINFLGIQISIFEILQHTSSIIGIFVVVFAIYKLPKNIKVTTAINVKYWIIAARITLTIIAIRFLCGLHFNQYGNVVVTVISAGLISLILTSYLLKAKEK